MTHWIGQTLSKVIIQKRLGHGGMAEVFVGHHTTLNRPVAVKILHGHLAHDPAFLSRFRAEAQAVAAMRHPNIVQIFDFDVVDDQPYIVMELLEEQSLGAYLHRLHSGGRTLSPETTVRLIVALATALDYAHGRGVIHRDIKPANVILRRESSRLDPDAPLPLDAEPVLTDFGVAHITGAGLHTAAGTIIGTPAYMSPEQARGEVVDARSDIYSLGVMLYEMLAGKPPFDVDNQSPLTLLLKHTTEVPPPVLNISPAVQAVVDRALSKDRQQRYQRTGDLAADLLISLFGQAPLALQAQNAAAQLPQLTSLTNLLDLLVDQARAYERALPPNNYPARAAVAALSELGRQALAEARDLVATLTPPSPAPHPFSPRELEVLALAAQGLTNKEIAYRLSLSNRTVQFHINSIFNKTTTSSRTEAVVLAIQQGWLVSAHRRP